MASCSRTAAARCSRHRHRRIERRAGLALVVAVCWSLFAPVVAVAADAGAGVAPLTDYLNSLASFSASFEQKRFDEYGELLETSEGKAYVQRPGRFRWSYTEPYLQSIITDGETLWIYDEDLEQVTVNPVGEAPAGSPAELLVEGADVEARYDITDGGVRDGYHWYRLSPKSDARDFRQIELGLADGEVRAMRLADNLGQTTLLEFADVRRNAVLAASLFEFTPPPGIDVIEGAAP